MNKSRQPNRPASTPEPAQPDPEDMQPVLVVNTPTDDPDPQVARAASATATGTGTGTEPDTISISIIKPPGYNQGWTQWQRTADILAGIAARIASSSAPLPPI